jgi:hypothetical protein
MTEEIYIQKQDSKAVEPASACSAVELATAIRQAGPFGARLGNSISNMGLVKEPPNMRGRWFYEENAQHVNVDMEGLVSRCLSGRMNARNIGAKSRALLCQTLNIPVVLVPRCKCCGQKLPKHMRVKQRKQEISNG